MLVYIYYNKCNSKFLVNNIIEINHQQALEEF